MWLGNVAKTSSGTVEIVLNLEQIRTNTNHGFL